MERLPIIFDTQKKEPIYLQIYQWFVNEMQTGRICQGEKLPSVRTLALQLNISKSTIENAYDKLVSEGYLLSKAKSGYYCDIPLFKQNVTNKLQPITEQKQEILYDFSSRSVEPSHFERKLWRRYMRYTLEDDNYIASYGNSQGEYALRVALAHYLYEERAVKTTASQLVIGAGMQPLLYLFCSLFKDRKLRVGFLQPAFRQAIAVFEDCHHEIVLLDDLSKIKESELDVLYLNIVGMKMKMKERIALLETLSNLNIMLIEDDYQGEMHYKSVGMSSLQGIASNVKVFYLNSFSKQLLPSMRMACMSFPSCMQAQLMNRIGLYNQTASKIEQHVFTNYIQDGHLARCIKRQRKAYLKKSALLYQNLCQYFPSEEIELLEHQLCYRIKHHFDKQFYENLKIQKIAVSQKEDGYLYLYFSGISDVQIEMAVKKMFEQQ